MFIRWPPPPRQEGMSAKISSPHSVEELSDAILKDFRFSLQIIQEKFLKFRNYSIY
jgi:hypothetical protein